MVGSRLFLIYLLLFLRGVVCYGQSSDKIYDIIYDKYIHDIVASNRALEALKRKEIVETWNSPGDTIYIAYLNNIHANRYKIFICSLSFSKKKYIIYHDELTLNKTNNMDDWAQIIKKAKSINLKYDDAIELVEWLKKFQPISARPLSDYDLILDGEIDTITIHERGNVINYYLIANNAEDNFLVLKLKKFFTRIELPRG